MLRERLDKLITDYRTIEWVMTNDVKDTSERIIARHSKLVDSILTYIRQEEVKLLRKLKKDSYWPSQKAIIQQAISRIEKELK